MSSVGENWGVGRLYGNDEDPGVKVYTNALTRTVMTLFGYAKEIELDNKEVVVVNKMSLAKYAIRHEGESLGDIPQAVRDYMNKKSQTVRNIGVATDTLQENSKDLAAFFKIVTKAGIDLQPEMKDLIKEMTPKLKTVTTVVLGKSEIQTLKEMATALFKAVGGKSGLSQKEQEQVDQTKRLVEHEARGQEDSASPAPSASETPASGASFVSPAEVVAVSSPAPTVPQTSAAQVPVPDARIVVPVQPPAAKGPVSTKTTGGAPSPAAPVVPPKPKSTTAPAPLPPPPAVTREAQVVSDVAVPVLEAKPTPPPVVERHVDSGETEDAVVVQAAARQVLNVPSVKERVSEAMASVTRADGELLVAKKAFMSTYGKLLGKLEPDTIVDAYFSEEWDEYAAKDIAKMSLQELSGHVDDIQDFVGKEPAAEIKELHEALTSRFATFKGASEAVDQARTQLADARRLERQHEKAKIVEDLKAPSAAMKEQLDRNKAALAQAKADASSARATCLQAYRTFVDAVEPKGDLFGTWEEFKEEDISEISFKEFKENVRVLKNFARKLDPQFQKSYTAYTEAHKAEKQAEKQLALTQKHADVVEKLVSFADHRTQELALEQQIEKETAALDKIAQECDEAKVALRDKFRELVKEVDKKPKDFVTSAFGTWESYARTSMRNMFLEEVEAHIAVLDNFLPSQSDPEIESLKRALEPLQELYKATALQQERAENQLASLQKKLKEFHKQVSSEKKKVLETVARDLGALELTGSAPQRLDILKQPQNKALMRFITTPEIALGLLQKIQGMPFQAEGRLIRDFQAVYKELKDPEAIETYKTLLEHVGLTIDKDQVRVHSPSLYSTVQDFATLSQVTTPWSEIKPQIAERAQKSDVIEHLYQEFSSATSHVHQEQEAFDRANIVDLDIFAELTKTYDKLTELVSKTIGDDSEQWDEFILNNDISDMSIAELQEHIEELERFIGKEPTQDVNGLLVALKQQFEAHKKAETTRSVAEERLRDARIEALIVRNHVLLAETELHYNTLRTHDAEKLVSFARLRAQVIGASRREIRDEQSVASKDDTFQKAKEDLRVVFRELVNEVHHTHRDFLTSLFGTWESYAQESIRKMDPSEIVEHVEKIDRFMPTTPSQKMTELRERLETLKLAYREAYNDLEQAKARLDASKEEEIRLRRKADSEREKISSHVATKLDALTLEGSLSERFAKLKEPQNKILMGFIYRPEPAFRLLEKLVGKKFTSPTQLIDALQSVLTQSLDEESYKIYTTILEYIGLAIRDGQLSVHNEALFEIVVGRR